MKRLLLVASLALVGSGCDQLARLTHVPSTPNAATSARHNVSEGEPGLVAQSGWQPGPGNDIGQGYGVWTWDPNVANGCNEHEVEPLAELDNEGAYCEGNLP